jgi:hypothetical protein
MMRQKRQERADGSRVRTVLWWEMLTTGDEKTSKQGWRQDQRALRVLSSTIPEEVSIKDQGLDGIIDAPIDASLRSRYSQAQIKDLVAYANPRYLRAVKSSGSRPSCAPGNLLQAVATSLSCCPPAASALTAENLYKHSPGGSGNGPARLISPLHFSPGGYRPF